MAPESTSKLLSLMQEEAPFIDSVVEVSKAFLEDRALCFAQELYSFISEGQSLASADRQLHAADQAAVNVSLGELISQKACMGFANIPSHVYLLRKQGGRNGTLQY